MIVSIRSNTPSHKGSHKCHKCHKCHKRHKIHKCRKARHKFFYLFATAFLPLFTPVTSFGASAPSALASVAPLASSPSSSSLSSSSSSSISLLPSVASSSYSHSSNLSRSYHSSHSSHSLRRNRFPNLPLEQSKSITESPDASSITGTPDASESDDPSATTSPSALSATSSQKSFKYLASSIRVMDNVVSPTTCQLLHRLALEHSKRSEDGSSIFYRYSRGSHSSSPSSSSSPLSSSSRPLPPLTPLETAIDSILTNLENIGDTVESGDSDGSGDNGENSYILQCVEYWSRPKYVNLEAHADVDENVLKEEGILRCPKKGHVLYLQISNSGDSQTEIEPEQNEQSKQTKQNEENKHKKEEKEERMGPTIVFPQRKIAWGKVIPTSIPDPTSYFNGGDVQYLDGYLMDIGDTSGATPNVSKNHVKNLEKVEKIENLEKMQKVEEMAIVPALNGRLLQFDGDAFHAVPKPPNRYLLGKKELRELRELEELEEDDCDEEYYDDYNDYDDDYYGNFDEDFDGEDAEREELDEVEDLEKSRQQRSVLLFNTWTEGSCGPRGVEPDGIANTKVWSTWQEDYGANFERVVCNPMEDWEFRDVERVDGSDRFDRLDENIPDNCGTETGKKENLGKVTIPLMGNPSRRGYSKTKAILKGDTNGMEEALYEPRKVSLFTLHRDD